MAKINPRRFVVVLAMAASALAVTRWFFLGVTASKWIGLPQYAFAMHEIRNQSRGWGMSALVLEGVAIALSVLPMKTRLQTSPPGATPRLTYPKQIAENWLIRAALCIAGTVAMILLFFFVIYIMEMRTVPLPR